MQEFTRVALLTVRAKDIDEANEVYADSGPEVSDDRRVHLDEITELAPAPERMPTFGDVYPDGEQAARGEVTLARALREPRGSGEAQDALNELMSVAVPLGWGWLALDIKEPGDDQAPEGLTEFADKLRAIQREAEEMLDEITARVALPVGSHDYEDMLDMLRTTAGEIEDKRDDLERLVRQAALEHEAIVENNDGEFVA